MYRNLRAIHRLLASFSLPFLLMYAISAVQMAHGSWFAMKPEVRELRLSLRPGLTDARAIAREVTSRVSVVRGELSDVRTTAASITLRLVLPGTVHEVHYDPASGLAQLKTSVAGTMGMLNRLHHAAGLWHEAASMKAWGVVAAVVSGMLLILGVTGVCLWFARRTERISGAVLLTINLVVVLALLVTMRSAGP